MTQRHVTILLVTVAAIATAGILYAQKPESPESAILLALQSFFFCLSVGGAFVGFVALAIIDVSKQAKDKRISTTAMWGNMLKGTFTHVFLPATLIFMILMSGAVVYLQFIQK